MRRTATAAAAAAIVIACLLAATAGAGHATRHRPARPETAGFLETLVLRIPTGQTPERISDALPGRGAAASLGGAFLGRDGRLVVWDADFANAKVVTFPPDGPARITVTPAWAAPSDSIRIVGGDADSLGNLYLVSAPVEGRVRCRVFGWIPGAEAWTHLDLPWYGGYAGIGGLDLREGARVRALADGRVVIAPAPAATGASALCVGAAGRFDPLDAAHLVDAAELARPRTDAFGRRLLPTDGHEYVLADSAGRPLASMEVRPRMGWKRLAAEPALLEPGGSLLTLHSTLRALVVSRLTPEIENVPALPGRLYGPPLKRQLPR